jgi:CBS domain-containing protein
MKEIMTKEVITTEASSTILDVMRMMVAKTVGAVVVAENQSALGIFTEQDVLKRVMNKNLDVERASISSVMTTPIYTVSEETHIVEALGDMYKRKFRHVLVCGEEGAMVGVVSMRDILSLAVQHGRALTDTQTIGGIMSKRLLTVDASQSIMKTIRVMNSADAGCVVVLSDGKPTGIFTERDILKRVAVNNVDPGDRPVKEVMTPELVTMTQSALISEVLTEMHQHGFRHMPIRAERGELVGLVSMGEVLRYAKALDVDEGVRKAWKEIKEFWDSEEHYTPG